MRVHERFQAIRRLMGESILIACILVLAVFPDVVFKGASLRMSDQMTGEFQGKELRPFYPIPEHTKWWGGYNDTGGAVFQSEPMSQFMRKTFERGDSPYWNPYSATGALGPETLVDQKFSPLSWVSVFIGGDSLTYNISVLVFYWLGVFFVYLTMRHIFQLSRLASTGAGIFYLLNGYAIANVGSNILQSYMFVPMCLYAVLLYSKAPSTLRFLFLTLTFGIMLACTFMPTTIVSIIGIYIIAIGFLISRVHEGYTTKRNALFIILSQLLAGVLAVLLLALLYFPVLESLESTGLLGRYAKRAYFPINFPGGILSLFSSSLFFESYNAMEPAAIKVVNNYVYYFGVVSFALAGCAYSRKSARFSISVLFYGIAAFFFLANLYGALPVRGVISLLPVVGNIGNQYWWMAVVLPLLVLIAFGIHNIQNGTALISPAILLILIGVASAFYINNIYGLQEPNINFKKTVLIYTASLTFAVVAILFLVRLIPHRWLATLAASLLVIGLFGELIADGKILRFERSDFFHAPSDSIRLMQSQAGPYRTLNFAHTGLYPELGSAFMIQEVTSLNDGGFPSFLDYFYSVFQLEPSQQFGYNKIFRHGPFPALLSVRDEPEKNMIDWERVDLLGVKLIAMPSYYLNYRQTLLDLGFLLVFESPATTIFKNPNVIPRAFSLKSGLGPNELDVELPSGFRSVLTPLEISDYRNTHVVIEGVAGERELVVLTDAWHKNWSATVNGQPSPVLKVNSVFRGIIVPAGPFKIEMSYRPKTLSLAFFVSVIAMAIVLIMLLYRRRLDHAIRGRWSAWSP